MATATGAVHRVARFLHEGEFQRGVLTLIAGTGLAQVIVIASSPVLTRLYAPSDYGIFAVATSILSVLITITSLRFEFAIPLPDSDVAAANVLAVAVVSNLVLSIGAAVILWIAGPWLLGLFGASVLRPYIVLLALGQLGGGVVATFTSWAVRTKTFSDIAATRLTQSGALVTVQVALGIVGFGAPGLLLGDIAGRVTGSTRLARAAWQSHSAAFRRISRQGIRVAAGRYRRFPLLSGPSALLSSLGVQAPVLILVAYFGTDVGGHYALADRLCSLPLTLVAGAVGQVFVAEAAPLARQESNALRGLFRRTTRTLALGAIGPAILLAIAAPLFAGLVFGSDWTQTGLFVAILAPMYYMAFVTTATGDALSVVERQDLHLVREIIRFGALGGATLFAGLAHLPATQAIIVLSASGTVMYVIYGLMSWWAIAAHRPRLHPSDPGAIVVRDPTDGWPLPLPPER